MTIASRMTSGPSRDLRHPILKWIAPVLLFLAFIGVWQLIVMVSGVSSLLLPGPEDVAQELGILLQGDAMYEALWHTSYALAIGFALGAVSGILLGMLLGLSRKTDAIAQPYLWGIFSAPDLAFVPLVILWFGFGDVTKVLMVFIGVIVPFTIAVRDGVRTVDESSIQAAVSFCATRLDLLRKVISPAIIPSLGSGVRNGLSRGFGGVLVVEMTVGTTGLGREVTRTMQRFETSRMLAYITILIILAIVLIVASKAFENYVSRWRDEVSV